MIVKMKKATVIMYSRHKKKNLKALKQAGVMHVQELKGKGEEYQALDKDYQAVNRLYVKLFGDVPWNKTGVEMVKSSVASTVELCKKVNLLDQEISETESDRENIFRAIMDQQFWGDFSPADLDLLEQHDVKVKLFKVSNKQLKSLELNKSFYIVAEDKLNTGFAVIEREQPVKVPEAFDEVVIPEHSLADLNSRLLELDERIDQLKSDSENLSSDKGAIVYARHALSDDLQFTTIFTGSDYDEDLSIFTGFCPESDVKELTKTCTDAGIGLMVEEPSDEDDVPVLVKNNKVTRMMKPVFGFLDTVPGYHEVDISPVFLLFFSIFFAMIIGDAGYGAILTSIIGITFFVKRKNKALRPALTLGLLLGVLTVVWGSITGNWFGSETLRNQKVIDALVIDKIDGFSQISINYVIWISFILGYVQLSIAHLWGFFREIRQKPRIKAFAHIGWLLLAYAMYDLIVFLIAQPPGYKQNPYMLAMIITALVIIFVFGNQEGKFFKGILNSFSNIITFSLDSIQMFSDSISYIRLFAVGIASAKVAAAFNMLAVIIHDMMPEKAKALGLLIGVLFLFIGHSLNLALGLMSVIVHGIRLNMLEFSGHLGMEWTGSEYEPFKDKDYLQNIKN